MNKPFVIKSDTAPATAKLVTRLAAALSETDELLSRVCGNFGRCEPGGCPLYPTQDEIDREEYPHGCIWVNMNSEFLTYVIEEYRTWRDQRRERYISFADELENCFECIKNIGDD